MGEDTVPAVDHRSSAEMIATYEKIQATAGELAKLIINQFNVAPTQSVMRCTQLAVEQLEACMHRVGDGMHFITQLSTDGRERTALANMPKAPGGFTVVNGGKA